VTDEACSGCGESVAKKWRLYVPVNHYGPKHAFDRVWCATCVVSGRAGAQTHWIDEAKKSLEGE
jgi:hypothetical protein